MPSDSIGLSGSGCASSPHSSSPSSAVHAGSRFFTSVALPGGRPGSNHERRPSASRQTVSQVRAPRHAAVALLDIEAFPGEGSMDHITHLGRSVCRDIATQYVQHLETLMAGPDVTPPGPHPCASRPSAAAAPPAADPAQTRTRLGGRPSRGSCFPTVPGTDVPGTTQPPSNHPKELRDRLRLRLPLRLADRRGEPHERLTPWPVVATLPPPQPLRRDILPEPARAPPPCPAGPRTRRGRRCAPAARA